MKRALSLIELLFTIVIIAFTFTVIPKIFQVTNKTLAFSSKEDALFNMYSQIMDIVLKEYDEKNTLYDDILLSDESGNLECNTDTGYRIGGFKGSRNCFHKILESDIPSSPKDPKVAIEDYNGLDYQIYSGHKEYNLSVRVNYADDNFNYDYSNQKVSFEFNKISNIKTNVKKINVKVLNKDNIISSITYYSANLGHIEIKSVLW